MNRFLVIFLIGLLFPLVTFAQEGSLYGGHGVQYGYRIKPTPDGGFIAGGGNYKKYSTDLDYYVIRFDRSGNPLWDSSYGRKSIYDFLWSVEPTRDKGSLLAGYSGIQNSGTEEALMYKIDSVGRIVKKIEVDYSLGDHAHWFKEAPDGNYFWAGHTDSKGDPQGDMIVGKLDKSFNKTWEKTYGIKDTAEHCHSAAITPDGGCILAGHTTVDGREKLFAVRIDASGIVKWQKIYGSSPVNHDSPYDCVVTAEGNYAFFGGSSSSLVSESTMWLLVVDSNGAILIDKHFGTGYSYGQGGIQSSDSGFVIIGYSAPSGKNTSLYIVKTDRSGNKEWEKLYGDETGAEGNGVFQRGSQFIAVGDAPEISGDSVDLWVLVLDMEGNVATLDTTTASVAGVNSNPSLTLVPNYPNPCIDYTTIGFWLPRADHIAIEILDATGKSTRKLQEKMFEPGYHYLKLSTTDLSNGTYYYKVTGTESKAAGSFIIAK